MKKQLKRSCMAVIIWCMMSLAVSGCGGTGGSTAEGQEEPPVVSEEPQSDLQDGQRDTEEDDGQTESAVDASAPGDEAGTSGNGESASDDKTEGTDKNTSRKNGNEDVVGDILELGDGQFTMVAAVTEEEEDGSLVMAAPAAGIDDPDFDKVTVTYDADTDIYIRTIYDNGARHEDTDASVADLAKDAMVLVWGAYGEDGKTIHAEQIQIDQFVR